MSRKPSGAMPYYEDALRQGLAAISLTGLPPEVRSLLGRSLRRVAIFAIGLGSEKTFDWMLKKVMTAGTN